MSTVTSRFRRRDILESIMYPSRVVSDQYTAVRVERDDFSEVEGMVVGENDRSLTLITVLGEREIIPKRSIVKREIIEKSIMPEGLHLTMNLGELVNLMQYLEAGSEM